MLLFDVNFFLTFFGYTSLFLGISILPHFFQPRCSWQEKQKVPVPMEATIAFDDDAPA